MKPILDLNQEKYEENEQLIEDCYTKITNFLETISSEYNDDVILHAIGAAVCWKISSIAHKCENCEEIIGRFSGNIKICLHDLMVFHED